MENRFRKLDALPRCAGISALLSKFQKVPFNSSSERRLSSVLLYSTKSDFDCRASRSLTKTDVPAYRNLTLDTLAHFIYFSADLYFRVFKFIIQESIFHGGLQS
mgnify:CR=1 FL=1